MNTVYSDSLDDFENELSPEETPTLTKYENSDFLKQYCIDYPQDPEGIAALGLYWFQDKAYKKAHSCFQRALSLSGSNPRYAWLMAWLGSETNNLALCYQGLRLFLKNAGHVSSERKKFARKHVLEYELLEHQGLLSSSSSQPRLTARLSPSILRRAV